MKQHTKKFCYLVDYKRSENMSFFISILPLFLSACGSSKDKSDQLIKYIGLDPSYEAPPFDYSPPISQDLNFQKLKPSYSDAYWIEALQMENGKKVITEIIGEHSDTLFFTFPNEKPSYLDESISWSPATEAVREVTREVFTQLQSVLQVKFSEVFEIKGMNLIAISQSVQSDSAGFSYFPNNFFQLGSDIFISNSYTNPYHESNGLTNYDYELIIHEIGHALGLKHPFEHHGANTVTLTDREDNTILTAMSYDQILSSFNGEFRPLDLMSLTYLYGVNSSYNADDDKYEFLSDSGVFIIDGAGIDTIDAYNSELNAYVDLRSGTHSHLGVKSDFISDKQQLTISHGSIIENVITGLGNDYIIANDHKNVIDTNAGNDQIFAGGGADIINAGPGSDTIDLSEQVQFRDTILISEFSDLDEPDVVYGFCQGANGDFIDLSKMIKNDTSLLPLVLQSEVPKGYIGGQISRIAGDSFNTVEEILIALEPGQVLESLEIGPGDIAIIISANSKETGEEQKLFAIENENFNYSCKLVLTCVGNYLDIDSWSIENFSYSADIL